MLPEVFVQLCSKLMGSRSVYSSTTYGFPVWFRRGSSPFLWMYFRSDEQLLVLSGCGVWDLHWVSRVAACSSCLGYKTRTDLCWLASQFTGWSMIAFGINGWSHHFQLWRTMVVVIVFRAGFADLRIGVCSLDVFARRREWLHQLFGWTNGLWLRSSDGNGLFPWMRE